MATRKFSNLPSKSVSILLAEALAVAFPAAGMTALAIPQQ